MFPVSRMVSIIFAILPGFKLYSSNLFYLLELCWYLLTLYLSSRRPRHVRHSFGHWQLILTLWLVVLSSKFTAFHFELISDILWVCSNRLTWQQFPPERSALLDFHLRFRAKVLKQRFAGSITAKSLKYRHGVPGATGNISKISHFDPEHTVALGIAVCRTVSNVSTHNMSWKMRDSIATAASMNLWCPVSQPCLCCQILFTASSNGYRPGRLEAMWLFEWRNVICESTVWGSIGKLPSFTLAIGLLSCATGTPGISYPSRRPHLQTWNDRTGQRMSMDVGSCLVKAGHHWNIMQHHATWVCLKMGYIPNYSHLVGIMIINHWDKWGTLFSDKPTSTSSTPKFGSWLRCRTFRVCWGCDALRFTGHGLEPDPGCRWHYNHLKW